MIGQRRLLKTLATLDLQFKYDIWYSKLSKLNGHKLPKFCFFFLLTSLQHFREMILKLILKFYRNRPSFKFRLKNRIRALRSASDFFLGSYLK